jgi:thiol-disulfide isomerase/thioredoxin
VATVLGVLAVVLAALTFGSILLLPLLVKSLPLAPPLHAAVGKPLAVLELAPLVNAEAPVSLADIQGRVALVNFWGTWCPPCLAEMPHLAEVYQRWRDHDDFRFLAVSCSPDPPGSPEDLDQIRSDSQAYLDRAGLEIPVYADPGGKTRLGFDSIGPLRGYPTTVLVDRRGLVVAVWEGFNPKAPVEIENRLAEVLAQPQ